MLCSGPEPHKHAPKAPQAPAARVSPLSLSCLCSLGTAVHAAPVTLRAAPGCWPGTLSSSSCSQLLWLGSCDPAVLSDTPWLCQSCSAAISFPSHLVLSAVQSTASRGGKAGWGSPSTTQGSPFSPAACLEARKETSNH